MRAAVVDTARFALDVRATKGTIVLEPIGEGCRCVVYGARTSGEVVGWAHGAGLFDLDLQPSSILVRHHTGSGPWPVFLDFAKVPYHVHAPNAFLRALVRMRLSVPKSRDLRYLKRLRQISDYMQSR